MSELPTIPKHLAHEFPFESKFLHLNGASIHYIDEGEGQTILLLPPSIGNIYFFKRLIVNLRPHYRVVAVDFPGFGLSGVPRGHGQTLQSYTNFVLEVVRAIGLQKTALLLNDTSGPIGLKAAAAMPNIFESIVLADTFGFPLTGKFLLVKAMISTLILNPIARPIHERFRALPWIVSTLVPHNNPMNAAERELFKWFFSSRESRERMINLFSAVRNESEFLESLERDIQLHLKAKPVLLLYGQRDPVKIIGAPSRFQKLFQNHIYVTVDGEEHFPILGSPEQTAAFVDQFLQNVAKGTRHPESKESPPAKQLLH